MLKQQENSPKTGKNEGKGKDTGEKLTNQRLYRAYLDTDGAVLDK